MSRMDDFVATLVAAAQAQAQAGRGPQPNAPQPPTDALIAAARQGGARQGVAAPDPWMAGDAIHGGPDGDMPDWQAAADVFARAAAMRKRRGQPLGGAVLVGQGTRGAGPNALIEAQQGTGQGQQTYQRGNVRYHVYFDEDGKRHVAAFHVGTGRRLN